MAAEYITKLVSRKKDGATVKEEVKYRVDADFVPENPNQVCLEFMMNYCKAHNEGDWLIATASKTIPGKNGTTKDYPFVSLRADFMNKFFKNAATSNKSMKGRIIDFFKK